MDETARSEISATSINVIDIWICHWNHLSCHLL